MIFLNVVGISKKNVDRFSVRDLNFIQNKFQKIAIAGETGSGKTTLLKIIAGLTQPGEGEIFFEGKKVSGPDEKLIPGHPEIAYLSQHFELRNNYRVEEELESKNLLTEKEADTIYAVCRIKHLLKRRTDQLSGGERQRVVLARLLTTSPKLLLLDEPYSNLDAIHKSIIKSVINDIREKLKLTCTMVLHDAPDILSWADLILVMKDGQIVQQDKPEVIYRQPVNEYVAALFGEYNLIDPGHLSISPVKPAGEKLFIRPEEFRIATADDYIVSGIVKKNLFSGSYYMLDVVTNEQIFKVKVSDNQFSEGDVIYLSLPEVNRWYI